MFRVVNKPANVCLAMHLRRCVSSSGSLQPSAALPEVPAHSMSLPIPRPEPAPAGPLTSMDPSTKMQLPYRKVGNVLMIHCTDHPFKYSWELNAMLRQLRIEYRGQVVIHPDIPDIRLALWRVRHIVHVESINTDDLKEMMGVPEHIQFRDLARELPRIAKASLGTSGYMEQTMDFRQFRRDRIKDIMKRDRLELTLLAERKKLRAAQEKDAKQVE